MARWSWWCCAIVLAACGCGQAEPDTTTARAKAAHLAGNFDEAIRLSTEAIAANPNDFDAFLCRGQAYHFRNQEGDYDRAVSDYTDAIDINPRMPEPFYRRALVYRDQGKLDLAGADDLRARSSDPEAQNAYRQLPPTTLPKSTPIAKTPALSQGKAQSAKTEEPLAEVDAAKPTKTETAIGSGGSAPGSLEIEERRDYERLKQKFETHDPFGRLTKRRSVPAEPAPSPFEAPRTAPTSPVAESAPGGKSAPGAAPGSASGLPGRGMGSATTGSNTAATQPQPPPSSPFLPRPTYAPSASMPVREGAHSPFPQLPSSPTGRVEPPANPFAPQQGQPRQYFPTPFSRPVNGPIPNPAVRN